MRNTPNDSASRTPTILAKCTIIIEETQERIPIVARLPLRLVVAAVK